MANNTVPTPPVTENTEETTSLDTVLLVLRRYWFIIILAALAGGTAAYYLAGRQQNYIYQKTASVLMRDAKTSSDASSERIMAELGIDSGAANLANESFILKSTALMKKVVEDLNLNTSYWQKKEFLGKARPLQNQPPAGPF
ncbi:Wzz/FepE/Etk N-terminal domain-containing protein [Akkermansia muciniphila]|uniref:Wzz/FepE/Etk N-terminal domain-containing protein n=1 Tax=Akkermansia muciniphila TaxID=239935 RepID=UPI0004F2E8BD|nr:Wzz/FepE/Etk N-terminal domain-containing protein [Akkermansia muciniphila]